MRRCLQTFGEYILAVFKWWWVIVIGFASSGVGAILNTQLELNIPILVWVAIALIGLFIAQFLAFHKIRAKLTERVIEPDQVEKILTRLAELRAEGVNIRNDGQSLISVNKQNEWINVAAKWRNKVMSEIGKLSTAEASIFETEDLVKISYQGKVVSEGHRLWMGILSQDTEKIRELVNRLSPQNLAQKLGIRK